MIILESDGSNPKIDVKQNIANSISSSETGSTLKEPEYFDKQDPEEDSIIEIDSAISLKYKKLENLYNQIVPIDYYEAAKKKSLSEQVRLRIKTDKNKTFTYGEMTFRTMAYVFEVIKKTFGQNAIKPGDFYDLGSVKDFY
jgi:hypothetical protein